MTSIVKRKFRKLVNDPKLFLADSKLVKMVTKEQKDSEVKIVQVAPVKKVEANKTAASTTFRKQTMDPSILSLSYLQKAADFLKSGEVHDAVINADLAVSANPLSSFVCVEASKVRLKLEDKAYALEYARRALELSPDSLFVLSNYAEVALQHGELTSEVEDIFQLVWRKTGKETAAARYLAFMWERRKASSQVAKEFELLQKKGLLDPALVAMIGAYTFDAGKQLQSLGFARRLLDIGEGKRIKKYPKWYVYVSQFYSLVKNGKDQKVVDLTSKLVDGEKQLVEKIRDAKRVVVVGNSPREIGKGLGKNIDSAELVIRFNNYPDERNIYTDYGKKCDVWVRSVGAWVEERDIRQYEHVVVSGTNLLGRGFNMTHFMDYLDSSTGISVFDTSFHYELINLLSGPPSAGLMMLYMIYRIRGRLDKNDVFGFGFTDQLDEKVKNIGNSPAGVRHHWHRELDLYHSILSGE